MAVRADAALVQRLIAAQFPQWANLPVTPVAHSGWDNQTFHLGDAMSVRLPRGKHYAAQVEKEQHWLPKLAPLLPLPIPAPIALGARSEDFPAAWSVYRWLPGDALAQSVVQARIQFARDLAHFLCALYAIDATGGPEAGVQSFHRGGDLTVYDAQSREAINACGASIDVAAATRMWDAACASQWRKPPIWLHGDIVSGNLLVEHGRLSAVIDFGTCAIGDPACDLAIAWTWFTGEDRAAFLDALAFDEDTVARGRGWALWKALITLPDETKPAAQRDDARQVLRALGVA